MRLRHIPLLCMALAPVALAEGLPDLGESAQVSFSPLQERRLGESIMREIRADPAYFDDAEATDYLRTLGNRLVTRGAASRQDFEFFWIRDAQINAFALPGGYIGVHTGLVLTAQSESEVASVLGHEIAHVTQGHIARLISQQKSTQLTSLAAMAVALLASRANSDIGSAAAAFGQASAIQSTLNFTRDNEREADRVGLQILDTAGFDTRAMPSFFERLQRATRLYEGGAPSYLRTHPLTSERIADIQNRVHGLPYRQVPDTIDFQLVRAKLKARIDSTQESLAFFEESIAERKFLSEGASRYGLVTTLVKARNFERARKEYALLRKLIPAHPMVATLGCQLAAEQQPGAAVDCYRTALATYPNYRAITYDYADALLQGRRADDARKLVEDRLQVQTDDYRLYLLQSRAYAMLNKPLAQHRAQGEAYARMGNIRGAVEQLQIGLKSGDGDFYQLSATEARLRQLRAIDAEQRKEERR
jgi:beta-barrel assembly-enhancing protease